LSVSHDGDTDTRVNMIRVTGNDDVRDVTSVQERSPNCAELINLTRPRATQQHENDVC